MQALAIADELYELIEQALTLELEDAERVFLLRQAFDTMIRALTVAEPYVFSDNAARWAYVQTKFQIPDDLVWQVDSFRRLTRPNAPAFGQEEVRASAHALARLVEYLRQQAIPHALIQLCAGSQFPPPRAAALTRLPYLRACVLDPPQELTDSRGRGYVRLRCRVEEPANIGIVTVLLQDLWADTPIWQNAVFSGLNLGVLNNALVATNDSFVVVEPDLLLSVSDVADCVMHRDHSPWVYLLRRFLRSDSSEEMMVGNIVNDLYDELLLNPQADFDRCFEESCTRSAVRLVLLPSAHGPWFLSDLRAKVRNDHFSTLSALLPHWHAQPVYIEPTILAPRYGIQGRLDTLLRLHANAPTEYGLFELKSGSPPKNGVWPNNAAQAQLYQLMLEAFSDGRIRATTGVLYSKAAPDIALRAVSENPAQHRALIQLRNLLAAIEFMLAQSPAELISQLLQLTPDDVPRYMQKPLEAFQSVLRKAREFERAYFEAFVGFVAREHLQARLGSGDGLGERNDGFADLWRKTILEKTRTYSVIAECQTISYDPRENVVTLQFPPEYRVSSFREGDIVILYRQDVHPVQPVLHQPILKGTIKAMRRDACEVEVKLRTTYVQSLDGVWAIEPDLMDVNFLTLYRSLSDFLSASRTRRDLLLGQIAPQQPPDLVQLPPDEMFRRLTDLQKELLRRVLSAPEYFLLQGPPGTGKTNMMLRSMVHFLMNYTNETVLLLAFTRRAVNEICNALHDMDYLRLGSLDALDVSIDPEKSVEYIAQQYGVEALRTRLEQARIIVSTVSGCLNTPELLSRKQFDVAIVDEASQLLEPHLVGILSQVRRFILIGDQNQLPAVVVQPPEQTRVQDARLLQIGVSDLRTSIFERLWAQCERNGWSWAYGMLEEQARMHPAIAEFPSQRFYGGRLRSLGLAHQQGGSSFLTPQSPCDLERELATAQVVFIPSPPAGKRALRKHEIEAQRVAQLAEAIYQACQRNGVPFDSERTLGVITPFRAQAAQIYEYLPPHLQNITVDTVERYQGSQREVILLSLAVSQSRQMEFLQALNEDESVDRKLNVALTRARQLLVVLGDESVLRGARLPKSRQPSHYTALIEHIVQFGKYWGHFPP